MIKFEHLGRLIKQIQNLEDQELNILSIYPLLPSYPWPKTWNVDFYIDATILQIIDQYKVLNQISKSYKREIINREKLNYQRANRIICRSNWAIKSLERGKHLLIEKSFGNVLVFNA